MKKFLLVLLAAASLPFIGRGQTFTNEIVLTGSNPILVTGTTTASGNLTLNVQPTAGDVMVLGTGTYRFVSAISGTTTNQIVISGSLNGTIANTVSAITNSGSSAGAYFTTGSNSSLTGVAGTGYTINLTAVTTGTGGNGVVTTGTFASGNDFFGQTSLSGGAVATGTNTIFTVPAVAKSGTLCLTSVDVIYQSGTLTAAPSVTFQSGTTVLTGTAALTGTMAGTATHVAALTSPLPLVISGTSPLPLSMVTTVSGTANPAFKVSVYIKGYRLQ